MNSRVLWLLAVGAALAVAIALGVFRSQEPGNAGSDGASSPSAANEARSPEERVVPERAEERIDVSSSPPASGAGDVPEAPQPVPVLLPNQVPATPMTQALEELQLPPVPELLETERAFAAESVDPLWSTATEARILGQISEIAGLKLASLNVECRTTLCRLQFVEPGTVPDRPSVTFPAPDRAASNRPSITDLVRATGLKGRWVIAVRDRNGTPVSLAYLERGETTGSPPDAREPPVQ